MWPFTSPAASRHPDDDSERYAQYQAQSLPAQDYEMTRTKKTKPSFTYTGHADSRLSIPLELRATMVVMSSFIAGMALGATHGSTKAAFRYRAENAHRMPTTPQGWFLYQKSKNYHSALGGMKEGVKMGSIVTAWTTLFVLAEATVDEARSKAFPGTRQRDVGSTVVAGLTVAGLYSWQNHLDHWTTARTARLGLKWSFVLGLAQDGVAWAVGQPPAYVDWVANKTWRRF